MPTKTSFRFGCLEWRIDLEQQLKKAELFVGNPGLCTYFYHAIPRCFLIAS